MMLSLDNGVGRVLGSLREANLERDTLVIFTSDNGGERFSDMGPFRERKMTLWEGGIRVAAMVRWPGMIAAGTTSDQVAVTMDWTSTLITAGGGSPDANAPLDGIDLLPLLTGSKAAVPRDLYWRTHQRTRHKAMRSGDWKYLVTETGTHLFDVAKDPSEANDLKAAHPDVFAKLEGQYAEWEREMLPPIDLDPARA
jgi:arylsulfatase A-like enzyme